MYLSALIRSIPQSRIKTEILLEFVALNNIGTKLFNFRLYSYTDTDHIRSMYAMSFRLLCI